jgi:hypothetical protein
MSQAIPDRIDVEGSGSSNEWTALGREMLLSDRAVHDEALEAVRIIVRNLRIRTQAREATAVRLFGHRIPSPSA